MHTDGKAVWRKCLHYIKSQVSEQVYKTWFLPIVPQDFREDVLTIQVPSQFFYEWLEEHYLALLKHTVYNQIGPKGKLEYAIIIDQGSRRVKPVVVNLPTYAGSSLRNHDRGPKTNPFSNDIFRLNPHYLFENLIEGECNQLAKSAAEAVAKQPGETAFNPLMIYGRVGLGKTHISQAIGNAVIANNAGKNVAYISSEKFTNQFIEALRKNNMQPFVAQYLQADVLILDDIQFLSGKEKTQEVFFHIFNHLHQSKRQIIITSDCAPRELKGLQERLLSRFKWGLTADLQLPDLETRTAIIQHKVLENGISFSEELTDYIAQHVNTNIRELEGVLISLIAHASLSKKDINISLAEQVLKHIVVPPKRSIDTSIENIQCTVALYYQIPIEALQGKGRKKEWVVPRQLAMHMIKKHTNHSLKSIGAYFSDRDHTTVLHAIKVAGKLLEKDQAHTEAYLNIENQIQQRS